MKEERVKNLNVGLLGISFLFVMTGFLTMSNIQPIVLDSARNETSDGFVPGFNGDGFISFAIVYIVFTFANLIAPAFVSIMGPRLTMIGIVLKLYYDNEASWMLEIVNFPFSWRIKFCWIYCTITLSK